MISSFGSRFRARYPRHILLSDHNDYHITLRALPRRDPHCDDLIDLIRVLRLLRSTRLHFV